MLKFILAVMLTAAIQVPQIRTSSVKGKIIDPEDGTGIGYADVLVTDMTDKLVGTAVSSEDGCFNVNGLKAGDVFVTVKMIGYEALVSDKITLQEGLETDLGTLRPGRLANGLQEVTVTADKNQIVYKLDRQTISASSALTAAGGTALDILAITPSVQVDADGEVTLRGSSNYVVYVNGKPSPLEGAAALRQIPSSSIEDIEIITTPSARYRTDGDTGIINITTKKSERDGLNGTLDVSAGTIGTWSADGRLGYKKGHSLWYVGGTAQDIKSDGDFKQDKTTVVDGFTTASHSDGNRYQSLKTMIANAGWQYSKGGHDLVLDLQAGRTTKHRGGNMDYNESRRTPEELLYDKDFYSRDHYILDKHLLQAALDYNWKISGKSTLSATSRLRYDRHSLEYTESNMFTLDGKRDEGTRGYEQEHHWDCDGSISYDLQYRPSGKMEAGYQYITYSEHGGYTFKAWDKAAQEFIWDDSQDIPFYYRRQTHSLFAMVTDRFGSLDFDAGLHADRVIDDVDIAVTDASRHNKRLDLFPSAHLSYDAGKAGIFSLGYSRRVNRPGIWQLEPYITYEDYYTRKTGNPDILPEFAHSSELTYRKSSGTGNSITATAYWRARTDVVDWVRAPYAAGITLDQVVNAGDQDEYGIETSLVLQPAKWWKSTLNGNIYRFEFTAQDVRCTDASGINWMAGWINNFTLPKDLRLQFDGHVIGPHILTQGREEAYCYFDIAAKKQILNGRMSLSLVAHDFLHTAVYENTRSTAVLESHTWVRPRYPNIILGLTFNFNTSASREKTGAISKDALFEGKEF